MRRRKCNWCIFKDGHKEKITGYYVPHEDYGEIRFTTRSGTYKYVEYCKVRSYSFAFFKYIEYPESESSTYRYTNKYFTLTYDIDRIEFIDKIL